MSISILKNLKWFLFDQFMLYGGGKGGGTPAPTSATSYQTNIPEYAKPYVTNMLNATQGQLFNTAQNAEGGTDITGFKPYKPYSSNPSDYYAGFSPMQQQAQSGVANMQMPGQIGDASNMAQQAGIKALNASYNPMTAGYNRVGGAQAGIAQLGNAPQADVTQGTAQNAQAAQGSAQDMQAAQLGNTPQAQASAMQAAQLGNTPQAQAAQFGGPQNVNAQNVGTQDYTGQNVQNYMSPYMQNVVNSQMYEANRNYDITGAKQQSQATQSGAFGGGREAIMAAENERNRNTALEGIQSQGYQNAFQNAQQQFNQQQQANLQAQQANQGANLQAGMANQQMGYNTGLQNAQLSQQAGLANQQLQGQYGLAQGQMNQAANQFNAANQQQAGLANQQLAGQYGLQQGQMNQAANAANQQAQNQFGMANLSNQQQANMANQQAGNQFGMANMQAQNQAGLANQALQGQYGMANMQSMNQGNQFNAQNRQQANLANQQAQLQAQQANINQQQFGANYGMQGLNQANAAAQNLGQLGGQQLSGQQSIYNMQNQLGGQQQAAEQSKINQSVQDYATAQQYPMMQLGMMSNMLRGLPMQSTAVQSYQAQAPVAQQAAGLLGAYNAYTGKKEGGAIKAMAKGGIADAIPGYKSGVLARIDNTLEDISQADTYAQPSEKQLPKLMQQTQSPGIKQLIATKQAEDQIGQNMSGVAAGNTGDLGMNMAEGGIIPRFAGNTNGSKVEDPMSLDAMTKQVMAGYATPEEALATRQGLTNTALQSLQGNLSPEEIEQQKYVQERRTGLSDKQRRAEKMNEALAWLKAGSTVGGLGTAANEGAKSYMMGQADIQKTYDEMNDNLVKQAADIKRAQRQEASGNATAAEASREKAQTHAFKAAELKAQIASSEKIAAGNNAATLGAASISAAAHNSAKTYEQNMIAEYAKENGITPAAAYAQLVKGATNKQEKLELDRAKIQLEATHKADTALNDNLAYVTLVTSKKPEDIAKAKAMRENLITEYIAAGTPKTQNQNPPASNKDKGTVDTKNPLLGGK